MEIKITTEHGFVFYAFYLSKPDLYNIYDELNKTTLFQVKHLEELDELKTLEDVLHKCSNSFGHSRFDYETSDIKEMFLFIYDTIGKHGTEFYLLRMIPQEVLKEEIEKHDRIAKIGSTYFYC